MRNKVFRDLVRQVTVFLVVLLQAAHAYAASPPAPEPPWSERMALTAMTIWKDSMALKPGKPATWIYEQGLLLEAIKKVWWRTGNGDYYKYIEKSIDFFVNEDGSIRTYKPQEFNIDNITPGRSLLLLAHETKKEKYRKAAQLVRSQIDSHPRTSQGGFWHKKIYPNQMWLDGLYMGQPFYAEYAQLYKQPGDFNDIAKQFILMEKNSRDQSTGLLYHGWDETKSQKWANPTTGQSPNFWGRAMGWYAMGLVDVLDYFPSNHPAKDSLVQILWRLATAIVKVQDPKTGLWYQVLNKPLEKGNYLEASASGMLVYALAKGHRKGYLNASFAAAAKKGFEGITKYMVESDAQGMMHLTKICAVAGLGGNPYRDGSFNYYIHEPVVKDDPKGVGAFILASTEIEILEEQSAGKGINVMLDYYFNNETKKNQLGDTVRFHYTWEDEDDSGFSFWGRLFTDLGAATGKLEQAPAPANLKQADVYIIVDPDTEKETKNLHPVTSAHATAISEWVRSGGILVLMGNDSGNTNITSMNTLSQPFGILFLQNSKNRVINNQYDMGNVAVDMKNEIFAPKNVFIKEYAPLQLSKNAKPVLLQEKEIVIAVTEYGKGKVFAIGDPWLYNEYVDGKRLPSKFQNFMAAKELAQWLIRQGKTQH